MDALPPHLDPADWAVGSGGLLVRRFGVWAKEKLFYVQRYIDIFNSGMKRKWSRRVYIDLFSGPGRALIADREEVDGSPLLALRARVAFTQFFFNDIEPLAMEALRRRIPAAAPADYLTLDCNLAADEIRKRMPITSLDLAFIDPTTWQIRFESIRKLTQGRRMDLIITFHIGNMKRAAEYEPASLDAFFGTSDWRNAYQSAARSGQRQIARALLDCYKKQLRSIDYEWTVDDVRITNTTHVGLYHLVFASKSARGEDFWKKITGRSSGGQLRLFREERAEYQA